MLTIRPETPADFAAIAALHTRAFDQRADEAVLVALLRQHAGYRPELALVAERDGVVAGHAHFTAVTMRLLYADVPAVILAPLGVLPEYQGQGIGGALLEAGHAAARAHGAAVSALLGHSSYYPRFGYATRVHGSASLRVANAANLPLIDLGERAPTVADEAALQALWLAEEGAVDLAIAPAAGLLEWLSPNPAVACRVWLRNGQIIGYTRVANAQPAAPRTFLAADPAAAQALAGALARRAGVHHLELPLHPRSASAAVLGSATAQAWDAGMACALIPGALDALLAAQASGTRPAGRIIWPAAFDLVG
jgi:predicted N-acetyltransferase YhbS